MHPFWNYCVQVNKTVVNDIYSINYLISNFVDCFVVFSTLDCTKFNNIYRLSIDYRKFSIDWLLRLRFQSCQQR